MLIDGNGRMPLYIEKGGLVPGFTSLMGIPSCHITEGLLARGSSIITPSSVPVAVHEAISPGKQPFYRLSVVHLFVRQFSLWFLLQEIRVTAPEHQCS